MAGGVVGVLKNLFGKDLQLEKVPEELRPMIQEMRLERVAFENAVKKGEQMGAALAHLQQQLAQLEQRLTGLDSAAARLGEINKGTTKLAEDQDAIEGRLAETRSITESARGALESMRA